MKIRTQYNAKIEYITAHLKEMETTQFRRNKRETGLITWEKLVTDGENLSWQLVRVPQNTELNRIYNDKYGEH